VSGPGRVVAAVLALVLMVAVIALALWLAAPLVGPAS
jgi:hypothetical protein